MDACSLSESANSCLYGSMHDEVPWLCGLRTGRDGGNGVKIVVGRTHCTNLSPASGRGRARGALLPPRQRAAARRRAEWRAAAQRGAAFFGARAKVGCNLDPLNLLRLRSCMRLECV